VARQGSGGWATLTLIAGVMSAPIVVFVGSFGLRFGWWGRDVALDLLALAVAPWLLGIGAIATLILLWRARRGGALGWPVGLGALAVVAGGVWLYNQHAAAYSGTQPSPRSVSTNESDPPRFSEELMAGRVASGGWPEQALGDMECSGVVAIPRQVRAEEASAALQDAGFILTPSSLFRVEGTHRGFWFQLRHDAVVRIRPGRTDVRVAAHSDRGQGDEACRLLVDIVEALQSRSR